MSAIWLLDIDGVVNQLGRTAENPWGDDLTIVDVQPSGGSAGELSYKICFSQKLIDRIKALADKYDVDLRLSSTWCGQAGNLLPALGLDIPDAFVSDGASYRTSRLKTDAFWAAKATFRPVIWTDDAAIPRGIFSGDNTLIIMPFGETGLTPAHLDEIEEFLKGKTVAAEAAA